MKNILLMLLLIFGKSLFAQKFTKAEKQLIYKGNVNEKMYVIQTDNDAQLEILLAQSKDIDPKNKDLKILIERMYLAVTNPVDGGVGIAAPQVGINRNVIWVQRFDKEGNPFEVYINPKITWKSKELSKGQEGCLSIPVLRGDVYRHHAIEIEYQDREDKKHSEKIEGFTAVIFQHEIDHLHGILFSQRIDEQMLKKYLSISNNLWLEETN
jgi:peptide deformylase